MHRETERKADLFTDNGQRLIDAFRGIVAGTELDKLFNMKDLTQSRHTRKNKAAPTGSEKIDKLFE